MQQAYRILTCALSNKEIGKVEIVEDKDVITYKDFQMVKNKAFNLVIARYKQTTVICLVTNKRVYFWRLDKDRQTLRSTFDNFMYRPEYPALANLVYVCYYEKYCLKWLFHHEKPFSASLAFAPVCPLGSFKDKEWKVRCCVELYDAPEEEIFFSWEIKNREPWNLTKTELGNYLDEMQRLKKGDKTRFVDYRWMCLVDALSQKKPYDCQGMDSARVAHIKSFWK
jgi:hypothetical protein